MKIDMVSSVGFRNTCFFVGAKTHRDKDISVDYAPSNSSSMLKKVPVIVLLAMNPATLNSAIPTMAESDNPNKIVMLAPETKSADVATYVISPIAEELQQSSAPFGWAYLGSISLKIQQSIRGESPFSPYNLVYTRFAQSDNSNDVRSVFLISDEEKKSNNKLVHPPEIFKLVYHNLGDEKEYCGAVVSQCYLDENGNSKGTFQREIRMDRNSAQLLINLITGHTNWNYKGPIEIEETTNPNTIY